jgi:hypothetical protein
VRVGLHCCFLTASPSPFGWPPKYTGAKMNLTKFYILWDAPEGVDTPHVLPLSICQSEYKTQDEFEADVFKRLEALGGYPVVGFMEVESNKSSPHSQIIDIEVNESEKK